jgi:hypothetical protein
MRSRPPLPLAGRTAATPSDDREREPVIRARLSAGSARAHVEPHGVDVGTTVRKRDTTTTATPAAAARDRGVGIESMRLTKNSRCSGQQRGDWR